MYIEVRSRNHCCCGKAISSTNLSVQARAFVRVHESVGLCMRGSVTLLI